MSLFLTLRIFDTLFTVSIVNFKHAIAGWEVSRFALSLKNFILKITEMQLTLKTIVTY